MPFNYSWLVPHRLAGSGAPGCALDLAEEMLPHEQRFLAWLNTTSTMRAGRVDMAERIGLRSSGPERLDEMYRKFRDLWHILARVQDDFGQGGEPVDRFVRDPAHLDRDLAQLRSDGVVSLLTLTERPVDADALGRAGLTALHLPVVDKAAPTPDQLDVAVAYLDAELTAGRAVAVHCLGGFGRTGTVLAGYLVHCGAAGDEAMAEVRRARPGSIETDVQEQAVYELERRSR